VTEHPKVAELFTITLRQAIGKSSRHSEFLRKYLFQWWVSNDVFPVEAKKIIVGIVLDALRHRRAGGRAEVKLWEECVQMLWMRMEEHDRDSYRRNNTKHGKLLGKLDDAKNPYFSLRGKS